MEFQPARALRQPRYNRAEPAIAHPIPAGEPRWQRSSSRSLGWRLSLVRWQGNAFPLPCPRHLSRAAEPESSGEPTCSGQGGAARRDWSSCAGSNKTLTAGGVVPMAARFVASGYSLCFTGNGTMSPWEVWKSRLYPSITLPSRNQMMRWARSPTSCSWVTTTMVMPLRCS